MCKHVLEAIEQASGLAASVGLGSCKFVAYAAGADTQPYTACIVPAGEEARFLCNQSVELLPVDAEVVFRLHLLGIETLGEVAQFTLPELLSQFGFEGQRVWQLARGIDEQRLKPRPERRILTERFAFEDPVGGIEVMIAVAKHLLARLQPALWDRAAQELRLQAELASHRGWERRIVFREPVSDGDRLFFLVRSTLQNTPPPTAIRSLTLCLSSFTGEVGRQLSLEGRESTVHRVEEAIGLLKTRYGYSPVYRCVDVEPWSVIPEERQILVESDA
jgi:nucleotidyltransferase/DNA polymerase involved in DNA repair